MGVVCNPQSETKLPFPGILCQASSITKYLAHHMLFLFHYSHNPTHRHSFWGSHTRTWITPQFLVFSSQLLFSHSDSLQHQQHVEQQMCEVLLQRHHKTSHSVLPGDCISQETGRKQRPNKATFEKKGQTEEQ